MKFDIVYYCDGYPEIGLGHLFRGIDIVNTYLKYYPESNLAIKGKFHLNALNFAKKQLNKSVVILQKENVKSKVAVVDTMFYPGKQEVNFEFFKKIKSDSIIFLWDAIEYDVPDEVDIVINHLPYCKIHFKGNKTNYTGLNYLPIAEDFYEEFEYRADNGDILMVLGSDKNPFIITRLLEELELLKTKLKKVVVLSPSFDKELLINLKKTYKNFEFKQYIPRLIDCFHKASVVITTYGNTTFQSLAAKIPTFTIGYQRFQDQYGRKLEKEGYTVHLGTFEKINKEKLTLLTDKKYKIEAHEKLIKTFKEPGIKKIIDIIHKQISYNN